jgi:hypothetical protein
VLVRGVGSVVLLLGRAAVGAAVAVALMGSGPVSANDWSPPSTVYVPATGHTVDGLFLDLWRERSDLAGDPITKEFSPRAAFDDNGAGSSQVTQFYENVAFLYDPDDANGEVVQLLDLGRQHLAFLLEADEPPTALLRATKRTVCPSAAGVSCRAVARTGQTVQGPVLEFWESTGGPAWLGDPLTEAYRAPNGSYVQVFEHGALVVDREAGVRPLPLGRVMAQRLGLDTGAVEPPADVPEYDEALFVPPPGLAPAFDPLGPGPQVGAGKELVVSIGQQAFWAYEGGEAVRASLVSTGTGSIPETETPLGSFQILTKYEIQDMEGTVGGYYYIEDVPDVLYFDNQGNAFHGAYWHTNFGTRQSRGCINLPLDVANWLYGWAPIGTPVTILP